jgi:rRNA-processing protein FCF1
LTQTALDRSGAVKDLRAWSINQYQQGLAISPNATHAGLAVGVGGAVLVDVAIPGFGVEMSMAARAQQGMMRRGAAAVDTNFLVAVLDDGVSGAGALRGRVPLVAEQAATEYLCKGSSTKLERYLAETGGRIIADGAPAQVAALQAQAKSLGRVVADADARIVTAAIRDDVALITNDDRLVRFLNAIRYPVENY